MGAPRGRAVTPRKARLFAAQPAPWATAAAAATLRQAVARLVSQAARFQMGQTRWLLTARSLTSLRGSRFLAAARAPGLVAAAGTAAARASAARAGAAPLKFLAFRTATVRMEVQTPALAPRAAEAKKTTWREWATAARLGAAPAAAGSSLSRCMYPASQKALHQALRAVQRRAPRPPAAPRQRAYPAVAAAAAAAAAAVRQSSQRHALAPPWSAATR